MKIIPPTEEEIAHRKLVQATDIFLGKLSVDMIDWSNVLTIQFNSLSPVLAARIANEIPEAYMLDQLQAKFDATEKATAWLTEQKAAHERASHRRTKKRAKKAGAASSTKSALRESGALANSESK